ncbi:hypothetical protein ADL15_36590 [Actinoplanes awajinensis subsp. mycoplanecinus]|uniref:Uncharacterized protein n=1 Tax=Actinoplanes awajinensis subsp. mycoplanecinus TaxID=135947 RepID=A0A101JHR6_9ACTN|nr:hypothetical protein ADL15_36590 [Actinoplanes awajinensis subsp. mycoplanecinus]
MGPLRSGMSPPQVAAALDGEEPAVRRGRFPLPLHGEAARAGDVVISGARFGAEDWDECR